MHPHNFKEATNHLKSTSANLLPALTSPWPASIRYVHKSVRVQAKKKKGKEMIKEIYYYASVTGSPGNELSHLSLSVSICISPSAPLSALPPPPTPFEQPPITAVYRSVRTTAIRHLARRHTSGRAWLSFSRECGRALPPPETPAGEISGRCFEPILI